MRMVSPCWRLPRQLTLQCSHSHLTHSLAHSLVYSLSLSLSLTCPLSLTPSLTPHSLPLPTLTHLLIPSPPTASPVHLPHHLPSPSHPCQRHGTSPGPTHTIPAPAGPPIPSQRSMQGLLRSTCTTYYSSLYQCRPFTHPAMLARDLPHDSHPHVTHSHARTTRESVMPTPKPPRLFSQPVAKMRRGKKHKASLAALRSRSMHTRTNPAQRIAF